MLGIISERSTVKGKFATDLIAGVVRVSKKSFNERDKEIINRRKHIKSLGSIKHQNV